jgi:hypothetical protein
MGVIKPLCGEEESAELTTVQATSGTRWYLRAANILCWIRPDAAVDVGEAVVTADRCQSPINR